MNFKEVIENIKVGEVYTPTTNQNIKNIECKRNGEVCFRFKTETEYFQFDGIEFRKEVKPLKFMEALKTNKKFLFKYETDMEYITKILKSAVLNTNDEDILRVHKMFYCDEYLSMDELLMLLGYILTPATLKEALENGLFYIKE